MPYLLLVGGTVAALSMDPTKFRPGGARRELVTATARPADFSSVVLAPGRVESTNSTEIRCTLERVSSSTSSTILRLIEDGTTVEKGAVLAELDSSAYEELVRQQKITVQQARASYLQAELDLEVAAIGFDSFRLGEMIETDRLYRAQIAMAESDMNRQADRLKWTQRMKSKGYSSLLQVNTDQQTMLQMTLSRRLLLTAFGNYQRFSVPKAMLTLRSVVTGARAALDFQTVRLRREEEKLALYQAQVANCTVRAPHGGFVIYANQAGRPAEVYEGAPVRQRQRLFTLPDLSEMEVQAMLHESVVNRVKPGMPVRARLEALPGLLLEGEIASISPFPLNAKKQESGSDVTYFLGKVKLTRTSPGVRPGMTTELEITTARRSGVLAVPQTAVVREGDLSVCTLVRGDRTERRAVTVGEASHNLIEVTGGLVEGDAVVLDAQEPVAIPSQVVGESIRALHKDLRPDRGEPSGRDPQRSKGRSRTAR